MEHLLVKAWMTSDPITVDPEATLSTCYHLMRLNGIRRLPVVDSAGRLVGIVTLGDIREGRPKRRPTEDIPLTSDMWERHLLVASREVREFMSPSPITVEPDTPVKEAARLMLEHKIGGLPVVDEGRVVGIITESDVFRLLVGQLPEV
jgi:acetoin utilization protein AcuB